MPVNLAQKIATAAERDEPAIAVLDALDALRVLVTVFDPHQRLIYANSQYNYLFRSLPPRETLIGQPYEALIRMEVAGGEIAQSHLAEGLGAFIARRLGQFTAGDYRPLDIVLADGRIVEIKMRRAPSGSWIGLWSDVTAARHNFHRLEDATALSADAFAFFDARDRFVMGNALYAQLHGARAAADLLGRSFSEIVALSTRRGRFAIVDAEAWSARLIETHGAPVGALTVSTTDGNAYLVRDRATRDGGRVVVFTDATDRRRAESALAEQAAALTHTQHELAKIQGEAEQRERYLADLHHKLGEAESSANTAKTTLLRAMSHELKTPLNAIIGFSDLMQQMADSLNPQQVAEYAGLIHQGGTNLLRLIMQILDLTKIAAGRYDLQRTGVDAGGVLWTAKGDFDAAAAAKGLTIDADACPIGLLVRADENAIRAMCAHLVDNAVRFTPQGGCVRLSVEKTATRICLAVRDNGPGVEPEDLDRILKPFEQSRRAIEHSCGAGLGLTLVKELAELHDGRLLVSSTPGEGFSAIVELPAA
ncbi:MAG TPA: PAS-domain containing protein [Rhizomicrobium sp.]|jgi:signal transduction histidine kinase